MLLPTTTTVRPLLLLLVLGLHPTQLRSANIKDSESTPFDLNRLGLLDWISSLLSGSGGGTGPSVITGGTAPPKPPEPIDPTKCSPCSCGLTNKMDRIVNGNEAEINEYPWMTILLYDGKFYCGATLITKKHAITAAHCVKGFKPSRITARLLEHNRNLKDETSTIDRKVETAIAHPDYDTGTLDSDIAILGFAEEVEFNEKLRPACLPPPKEDYAGEEGIVTGWGATKPSKLRLFDDAPDGQKLEEDERDEAEIPEELRAASSATLQELTVPILTNQECKMMGYKASQITDNMMCAGFKEGGKDSCQGDSGGPLHVANHTFHYLAGLRQTELSGVYTRVNHYLPWIVKYTADACFCTPANFKA